MSETIQSPDVPLEGIESASESKVSLQTEEVRMAALQVYNAHISNRWPLVQLWTEEGLRKVKQAPKDELAKETIDFEMYFRFMTLRDAFIALSYDEAKGRKKPQAKMSYLSARLQEHFPVLDKDHRTIARSVYGGVHPHVLEGLKKFRARLQEASNIPPNDPSIQVIE